MSDKDKLVTTALKTGGFDTDSEGNAVTGAKITLPTLAPEVEKIIEQYHMDVFYNKGLDVTTLNNARAATDNLKAKLAAVLAKKE